MDITPKKALVVLSGGQDSTTALFWAVQNFDEVHAITFDYGQRHKAELEAAHHVANLAGVKSHHVVHLPNVLRSASPLVDLGKPLETYKSAEDMAATIGDRVEITFVPMRNALFLVIAANHAVAAGIFDLVTGVCQEDNANYPDCRGTFIDSLQETIHWSLGLDKPDTRRQFVIHTPLMDQTKAQTVQMAWDMANDPNPASKTKLAWAALAHTHTAYSGEYPPRTQDHATVLRAKGFEEAGKADPLIVRAYMDGLITLPNTSNYDDLRGKTPIQAKIEATHVVPAAVDPNAPTLKVGQDNKDEQHPVDTDGVKAGDAKVDDDKVGTAAFASGDQGTVDDPNRGHGEGQATDPTGDANVDHIPDDEGRYDDGRV